MATVISLIPQQELWTVFNKDNRPLVVRDEYDRHYVGVFATKEAAQESIDMMLSCHVGLIEERLFAARLVKGDEQ